MAFVLSDNLTLCGKKNLSLQLTGPTAASHKAWTEFIYTGPGQGAWDIREAELGACSGLDGKELFPPSAELTWSKNS